MSLDNAVTMFGGQCLSHAAGFLMDNNSAVSGHESDYSIAGYRLTAVCNYIFMPVFSRIDDIFILFFLFRLESAQHVFKIQIPYAVSEQEFICIVHFECSGYFPGNIVVELFAHRRQSLLEVFPAGLDKGGSLRSEVVQNLVFRMPGLKEAQPFRLRMFIFS